MRFEFSRWQCQGWRTALGLLWHMAQGHLETDVYLDIFEGVWKLQVALKTRTTQPFLPLFGQRRCKDVQGALECRKVFTTFTSEAATEILLRGGWQPSVCPKKEGRAAIAAGYLRQVGPNMLL